MGNFCLSRRIRRKHPNARAAFPGGARKRLGGLRLRTASHGRFSGDGFMRDDAPAARMIAATRLEGMHSSALYVSAYFPVRPCFAATTSAIMLTAISSGVLPPIFKPIGACSRAS